LPEGNLQPGTSRARNRITRTGGAELYIAPHYRRVIEFDDEPTTTRKPMLLFQLSGLLLLRTAPRALLSLLFHDPPRNTQALSACPFQTPKVFTHNRKLNLKRHFA